MILEFLVTIKSFIYNDKTEVGSADTSKTFSYETALLGHFRVTKEGWLHSS